MRRPRRIQIAAAFLALGALAAASCGGGGGGPPPPQVGIPILCAGTFVNIQTNETRAFPCQRNGAGCDPITDPASLEQVSCGVNFTIVDGERRVVVPGLDRANLQEGFCACRLASVPLDQQDGSCQSVCEDVALKSPQLNNNDPNGPWRCQGVVAPADGEKTGVTCTPGSVVLLNGGPSEYLAQLSGTQETSGSVDLGVTSVSRSASSGVSGWMTYSTSDRSRGCGASGCRMLVSRIGLKIDPFHIDGFSVEVFGQVIFSFGGLTLEDAGVMNQGYLEGVVFDDGRFSLPPGSGRLIGAVDTGSSTDLFSSIGQTITGTVDFTTGDVDFDPFSIAGSGGQMTVTSLLGAVHAGPPRANIATAGIFECTSAQGTAVVLDAAGTTEPDGEAVTFAWSVNGASAGTGFQRTALLQLGPNEVRLAATDSRLSVGRATKQITVQDTSGPIFLPPGDANLTSCDPQVDLLPLSAPQVTDGCTGIASLQAFLVIQNGVPLTPPRALNAAGAQLPAGQHTIRWVARDGAGNESSITQAVRVGPAIQATDHFELRDRTVILNGRGVEAAVGSTGGGQSQLGVQARLAEILSVGPIFLQNFAVVTGRATSQGSITLQQGATVGVLQPNTPVNLGQIPWLQGVSGTVFSGADVTVPPDTTRTLTATSFGRLQVMSRSRATIPAQAVIRELWLEPDSTLALQGPNGRLIIRDRFVDRGQVVAVQAGSRAQLFLIGDELRLERPLEGVGIVAPNARVTVTTMANNTRVPLLVGKAVEVQPDVRLVCDRGATLPQR